MSLRCTVVGEKGARSHVLTRSQYKREPGDGDFVLTDVLTGAETRLAIEPGKLISWPNAGFSHRVENASPSVLRRILGPMAVDKVTQSLVAVGFNPEDCQDLDGYICNDVEATSNSTSTDSTNCYFACYDVESSVEWSAFNSTLAWMNFATKA